VVPKTGAAHCVTLRKVIGQVDAAKERAVRIGCVTGGRVEDVPEPVAAPRGGDEDAEAMRVAAIL